jgi:hypothetical protein
VNPDLVVLDLWDGGFQRIPVRRISECACRGQRRFPLSSR